MRVTSPTTVHHLFSSKMWLPTCHTFQLSSNRTRWFNQVHFLKWENTRTRHSRRLLAQTGSMITLSQTSPRSQPCLNLSQVRMLMWTRYMRNTRSNRWVARTAQEWSTSNSLVKGRFITQAVPLKLASIYQSTASWRLTIQCSHLRINRWVRWFQHARLPHTSNHK